MSLTVSKIPSLDDDDAIELLARADPGWKIELSEGGSLVVGPTFSDNGARDLEAAGQLRDLAKRAGGKAFGSSTRFRVPGGGLKSPDASWTGKEHLDRLSRDAKQKFWNVCPNVVVELLSETDSWTELREKVELYFCSGARYAVGIDPYRRDIYVLGTPPEGLALDFDAIIDA